MQTKPVKIWINRAVILFSIAAMFSCQNVKEKDKLRSAYPISGVAFNQVQLNDNFWLPKIKVNRDHTIPAAFQKCEEMGRMDNFLIAGGKMAGPVKGEMPFDDTDVYKTIEGAAYSLTTFPDPKLDAYVDSIIAIIAIGQEADGYLTTYKTIDTTNAPASWCPAGSRWQNLECSHELYNSGHLFEAAAAHYAATGKTNFLDIALKNADLLVKVFTEEHPDLVPGHQIVETGLIKLYLITQNEDYLKLARHFLDTRGDSTKHRLHGPYTQDHKPVTQQDEAVGHAVRAAYMYAGMTDIAAFYNDSAYTAAVENIWNNVVSKKMYLTGGIGSRHDGEAFGDNYELPNASAYNETCAAIANVYWNYRMFLLKGDAKYLDVLERSLYNNVISGVSLDGTHFFYPNPLECNMHYPFNRGALTRQPWFDCSCCPTNLARFMPSVAGYIYAHHEEDLYVNLYVQSSTEVDLDNTKVGINQETNYPWDGTVKLTVKPEAASNFNLKLRIPGWAENQPVPSDLYSYENKTTALPTIKINGQEVDYETEKGFAVLNHDWQEGDEVELNLPMEVKKVLANENVEDDRGKVAIERGPIVYCLEETDNPQIDQVAVTPDSEFSTSFDANLLHGVEVIQASGNTKNENFKAIPYFVWNNRGANKMKVWINQ
ncbi:glycoside hydrolase family 127 protein [Maribellus sediminis]|uniref:glycoside hydrolase family 127 protein n=1 Tax=Maribellus sediminis TaxID=2696285 RepID=UPI00142FB3CE|nr:glycoside hydrolase family 127 protein [Maribellus sediminis]